MKPHRQLIFDLKNKTMLNDHSSKFDVGGQLRPTHSLLCLNLILDNAKTKHLILGLATGILLEDFLEEIRGLAKTHQTRRLQVSYLLKNQDINQSKISKIGIQMNITYYAKTMNIL